MKQLRACVAAVALLLVLPVVLVAQTVTVEPLQINTRYDDFAPCITQHGATMLFSSDVDGRGQRIMMSTSRDGEWTLVSPLDGDMNDAKHSGCATLTPDGQMMVFSSTGHDVQGAGRTDLYVAYKRKGAWRDVAALGALVNSPSYDAQPSITSDGRTLYFVSDRPGGQGETDVFVVTYDGTDWTVPVPLSGVNSPWHEMSPVISADGRTLYFGSNRPGGAGGYDVYVATVQNGAATSVRRMREPINSAADELFYTALPNTDRALLSRSTAAGDLDISLVTPNPFPGEPVTLVDGVVRDAASRAPLGAEITVTDLKSGKRIATLRSDDATGAYYVTLTAGRTYSITAMAEDHVFYSERYEVPSGAKGRAVTKDIALSSLKGGNARLLVFFDLDKSELKSESMPELERVIALLRQTPTMRIEFDGHTDDQGNDSYNDALSQRRADAVRSYVVSAGIDASRLIARGFGKRRPMAQGTTDDVRQLNRRVEMQILSDR